MTLKSLQHLLVLLEHRHFGRAAAALGMTQPALTKSIQRLEKLLGAKLLDRSKRGVHPTAIGEQVIRRARPLITNWSELRREVDLLRGMELGRLTVGVGPAMAESFVTTAIGRLAQTHPSAHIIARVDHANQLSDWLRTGELDLFIADFSHVNRDHEFKIVPMPSEQLIWFCRRGHPLAKSKRVTRKDLLAYPLVTPRMPTWARQWFKQSLDPDSPPDPDQSFGLNHSFGTVECENYSMLKRMVQASDCLSAALSSTINIEITNGTLAALPVKAPTLKTKAGIVHLRGRTLSPLAETFMQEVIHAAKASAAGRGF